MARQWYEVDVVRAHRGAGRIDIVKAYIFAEGILEVLDKRARMPGSKRVLKKHPFPTIRQLSKKESNELERKILHEKRTTLYIAKKTWYYKQLI